MLNLRFTQCVLLKNLAIMNSKFIFIATTVLSLYLFLGKMQN